MPAIPMIPPEPALEAEVSPFQLCRPFRRETSLSPHAYLILIRARLAKRLLLWGFRFLRLLSIGAFLLGSEGFHPNAGLLSCLLAGVAFTLVGMTIAWIQRLLDRVNKQAWELNDERKILQEEIEKRIQAEERLIYEALHDPLTCLPNRRLFMDRLAHAVEWNKRHADEVFAVVYLDFDQFKVINDSLGHDVGNRLLINLAERLRFSTRAVDLAARMGSDEFAIILATAEGYGRRPAADAIISPCHIRLCKHV